MVQLAICEVPSPTALAAQINGCRRPIIVARPAAAPSDIDDARCACDVLEAELADIGDFAGYMV